MYTFTVKKNPTFFNQIMFFGDHFYYTELKDHTETHYNDPIL